MTINNYKPTLIEAESISVAWGSALLKIVDNPGKILSPLLVSINNFNEDSLTEDNEIYNELDRSLIETGNQNIKTVANTIFPYSIWKKNKQDRNKFYKNYIDILPRIKALEKIKNRRGLYFERLIKFSEENNNCNQLEHIINEFNQRNSVRRSMLQAATFDPVRDHSRAAQMGFPCLQHISFVPVNDYLNLNAFYATQQLFMKAYGNYLGLCRLGNFMAHEMNLNLGTVNFYIGIEKLEGIGKTSIQIKRISEVCRSIL